MKVRCHVPRAIEYNSRHALAKRIQSHAKPSFDTLNLLPYDRFAEDSAIWWLVPSRQSPAHCDTKFYIGQDFDGKGMMDVGIHTEKGFGDVVNLASNNARRAGWIMNERWHWHKFRTLVESGRVLSAMQSATLALGEPVYLRLYTYVPASRSEGKSATFSSKRNEAIYRLDVGSDTLHLDHELQSLQDEKIKIEYPQQLDTKGFSTVLAKLEQRPWIWVDLHITAPFAPQSPDNANGVSWNAHDVWNKYLNLFSFAVASLHL